MVVVVHEESTNCLLKVILLGDTSVGKTSLNRQYVDHKFIDTYKATIGADFKSKDIMIKDKQVTMQVWDTAASDRFYALGVAFYRASDCLLLVYDVTNAKSFSNLNEWLKEFEIHTNVKNLSEFPIAVLGNKSDKEDQREVPKAKAEEWCKKKGIAYFETSAKTSLNVEEAYACVAEMAVEIYKKRPPCYYITPCNNFPPEQEKSWCIIQ